ncbi:MAG: fasciclin domain-containing protein, partial [Anaerolineae bacterium]|nr:fasciclin domain-containing protein [Anaerolineae bacterium]
FLPAEYLTDEIEAMVGNDMELLAATLQDHVVEGYFPFGQLLDQTSVTTLGGNTYDITVQGNSAFVGGHQILRTNIFASNGVIHVIDGILGQEGDMGMNMEGTEEMSTMPTMEGTEEMDMQPTMEGTEEMNPMPTMEPTEEVGDNG